MCRAPAGEIPTSMLVGDENENPEFEARDMKIVEVGRARFLDRGLGSPVVERIWNSSASSLVDQWIEANNTSRTAGHINEFFLILSSSIFKVLRRVAGRTVARAQDLFHACHDGGFMDRRTNEICRRSPLGMACLTTNCDRRSYPQNLWRVRRQLALNYAMGSNFAPAERPSVDTHGSGRPPQALSVKQMSST
jgi:hypothetical protein